MLYKLQRITNVKYIAAINRSRCLQIFVANSTSRDCLSVMFCKYATTGNSSRPNCEAYSLNASQASEQMRLLTFVKPSVYRLIINRISLTTAITARSQVEVTLPVEISGIPTNPFYFIFNNISYLSLGLRNPSIWRISNFEMKCPKNHSINFNHFAS